jgi:putative ABC transport system permease protein
MVSNLKMDLRYAARLLTKAPGFTAAVVLTLALGIGANTTMFTAVEAFVLRPLPLPGPERLVIVPETTGRTGQLIPVSYPDFLDWKAAAPAFASLSALQIDTFNVKTTGPARRVRGSRVSASFFRVMALDPQLGRAFGPEQDSPIANPVVVLGHSYWANQFASNPAVLGRTMKIDGIAHTIVGVMPPALRFPGDFSEFWVPLAPVTPPMGRNDRSLTVVGRLRIGATLDQARSELRAISVRLEAAYPATNRAIAALAVSLGEQMGRGPARALMVLTATVLFVLLICCANIANLLLARLLRREEEFAVRAAIGASPRDLLRQLLTENLLLAALGGALGLIFASWGVAGLAHIIPPYLQPMGGLTINPRVMGYCAALTALTVLVFGLFPALSVSRHDILPVLRRSGPGASGGRNRASRVLVTAELALAVLLVNGSGLLINWLRNSQLRKPGFEPRHVLTAEISTTTEKFQTAAAQAGAIQELVRRLEMTPGVTAASAINWPPMTNDTRCQFAIQGRDAVKERLPQAAFRTVTPRYAEAMGIPLLRGRFVSAADIAGSEPVVVINQRLARTFWPGDDPLGKAIATLTPKGDLTAWSTVVGVIGDIQHAGPQSDPAPELYFPFAQRPQASMYLVMRTAGEPAALVHTLETVVQGLDPDLPLNLVRPMEGVMAAQATPNRITAGLMTVFSILALALAALGLYGVMAHAVIQRTQEFGIRLALGGTSRDLLRLVLRQAGTLALAGGILGTLLALGAARMLAAAFEGLRIEPLAFVVVAAVLGAVTLLAGSLPLGRVLSSGPLRSLRQQ